MRGGAGAGWGATLALGLPPAPRVPSALHGVMVPSAQPGKLRNPMHEV